MTVLSGEVVEMSGTPTAANYKDRPRWWHGTFKPRLSDAELDEMDDVIDHAFLASLPESCSLVWWNVRLECVFACVHKKSNCVQTQLLMYCLGFHRLKIREYVCGIKFF